MYSTVCQRWRHGRDSYRPAREVINPTHYGVDLLDVPAAKKFVETHHYSHKFPSCRLAVGLFRKKAFNPEELVGTAVFSVPVNQRTVPAYTVETDPNAGVELGRFVLLDDVEANGETWTLRRAFELLRKHKPGVNYVISYSDPVGRKLRDGRILKPGHIGRIYKAHNGAYAGRASAETLLLAPNGICVNRRALCKLKNEERGWRYTYKDLLQLGAPPRRPLEDLEGYVHRVKASGCFRTVKHPGNHVYVWALDGTKLVHAQPPPTMPDGDIVL